MDGLLHQAGEMTILISSHELGEIDGVATHVAFLDEGKLLFEESMSDLVARFREVHVTLDRVGDQNGNGRGEVTITAPFPKCWLRVRTMGNVLSFVDTRFSEGDMNDRLRSLVGNVKTIDAQPMALRSIFTTLARAAREGALQ
jgi:ABC-2 type transport system ATP-binding protein